MPEPWNLTESQRRQFREAHASAKECELASLPDVRPGQVWADRDWRSEGRTLRVDAIEGDKAACTVLTNSNTTQARLDGTYTGHWAYAGEPQDARGKTTRISLKRFKPTSTGYRLLKDAPKGEM